MAMLPIQAGTRLFSFSFPFLYTLQTILAAPFLAGHLCWGVAGVGLPQGCPQQTQQEKEPILGQSRNPKEPLRRQGWRQKSQGSTQTSPEPSWSTPRPGAGSGGSRWGCSGQRKHISALRALTVSSPLTKQPKFIWNGFWQAPRPLQRQHGWQWHLWAMQPGKSSFLNYSHWSPAVMFSIENLINKRGSTKFD